MSRVTFNVSGTIFQFEREILQGKTETRLNDMIQYAIKSNLPLQFTVDRNAACFAAILDFLETDELHIPQDVCPGVFGREMDFWGIDRTALNNCCQYRHNEFLAKERRRVKFRRFLADKHVEYIAVPKENSTFATIRAKVWNVINHREPSIAAKVYLSVVFIVTLSLITAIAFNTVSEFRQQPSVCQQLEYLQHSGYKAHQQVLELAGYPDCASRDNPSWNIPFDAEKIGVQISNNNQRGFFWVPLSPDKANKSFEIPSGPETKRNMTLVNVTTFTSSSTTEASPQKPSAQRQITISKITVPHAFFKATCFATMVFFAIDLTLNIVTSYRFGNFIKSVINITDIFALLALFAFLICISLWPVYFYLERSWVHILLYFQFVRWMRIGHHLINFRFRKLIPTILCIIFQDFAFLTFLLLASSSVFGLLFYIFETETNHLSVEVSILVAWYWAVNTMTTVGYGDVVPVSGLGRWLSCACAYSSLIVIVFSLPLFVRSCVAIYELMLMQKYMMEETVPKLEQNHGSNNMLLHSPVFVKLNAVSPQPMYSRQAHHNSSHVNHDNLSVENAVFPYHGSSLSLSANTSELKAMHSTASPPLKDSDRDDISMTVAECTKSRTAESRQSTNKSIRHDKSDGDNEQTSKPVPSSQSLILSATNDINNEFKGENVKEVCNKHPLQQVKFEDMSNQTSDVEIEQANNDSLGVGTNTECKELLKTEEEEVDWANILSHVVRENETDEQITS